LNKPKGGIMVKPILEVSRTWEVATESGDILTVVGTALFEEDYSISIVGEVPLLYIDDIPVLIEALNLAKDWVEKRGEEDSEQ
jgi:hypothetical protein